MVEGRQSGETSADFLHERKVSKFRGRSAVENPANQFESVLLERDADWDPAQNPAPKTKFVEMPPKT